MFRSWCWLLLIIFVARFTPQIALAQGNWSGQVQCRLDDVDQSYSRHELQTWMLTGSAPAVQGAMYIYPATWSVSGQGGLQRVQGAQITNIQWTTNVPPMQASIAIFIRASDNRLIIKPWHSQQRMDYAINGMRQIVVNGSAQQPTNFSKSVWEWQFPRIEDSPTTTNVSGSTQSQADSGDAELGHHFGGMPPATTCQWQFTKGGMAPTNSNQNGGNNSQSNQNPQGTMAGNTNYQSNGQNCETPATVQQSFENMKANVQAQYNQLIQGASDPSQVAVLQSQEQRMMANLNNQEQHDMAAASQGCVQAGNPNANGGSSYGSNQNGGNNQNPGNSQYSGGNQYSGNGQNGNGQSSNNGQNYGSTQNNQMGSSNPNGSSGSGGQSPAPQLLSITPSSVSQGSTVQVNLMGQGTHWTNATNVSFGPQVTLQSLTVNPGGTSAVATISVASNASPGSRPVMLMTGTEMVGLQSGLTVVASSGQQSGSGSDGFTKTIGGSLPPSGKLLMAGMLVGASPATNNGQQNVTVTLTGQGTNFADGSTTVAFARVPQSSSTNSLVAKLPATVAMRNTSAPPPLQVVSVKVTSKTTATATLNIDLSAAAGIYSITATTPTSSGPESVTLNNGFTVTTMPTLSGINLDPGAGVPKKMSGSGSPTPASGNYLVTITSLRCGRETLDDPFQRDGKGDEIYASAFVRHYDRRSSQLVDSSRVTSVIYGDSYQAPDRVQSGTRSGLGGIQDSDIIPDYPSNAPVDRGSIPPQDNMFPLRLFQGTLTDGVDALVVSPSIWEWDGEGSLFLSWVQNQTDLNQTLISAQPIQNQINNKTFGIITLGNVSGGTTNASVNAWETMGVLAADAILAIPAVNLPANGKDRPIGLAPNDSTSSALPNTTVVLTREIIEAALSGTSPTVFNYFIPNVMKIPQIIVVPKPGIMVIVFTDSAQVNGNIPLFQDGPASYAMILQVERQ
ncbi:MAG TPA: hypothetical protein VFA85_15480 [Terriglobales bacterium]|nr:hypothetical protein [Terriglobales bacterium]